MAQIYSGASRTVIINHAASGNNELIPAPTDGYIAIDHINLLPTVAVTVTLRSGETALTGPYPLDVRQPITIENASHKEEGIFTCARNTAFNMTLSAAVQVGGYIQYRVVGNS
ncbi:MAG: hypothetical protein DDT19_01686 [Syntrophomonadaceae bacterium]|nr:hypothetical protein [Bacillota bacterium]